MRPALRVVQAANLIRRLIDACTTGELRGVVAVFAVLPGFLQRCSVAYAALGQRIQPTEASRRHSPWRWPTLDLQAINSTRDADAFADGAIRRMCELIENAGIPSAGARDQMRHAAGRVLEQQAGGGYRGDLMKALAAIALAEVSS